MGRNAGEEMIEQGPEGVDVPSGVGVGTEVGLLRRHVVESAESRILFM